MRALGQGAMLVVTAVVFGGGLATAQAPRPQQPPPRQPAPMASPSSNQRAAMPAPDAATMRDVEATFGFVPAFIRAVPTSLQPSFWMTLKNFQMGEGTALDNKTKELIGLAVAAQIPCEYCVMFHTEAARMNGASDAEIKEAVGMAAVTREASTLINGLAIDKAQFKRDLDRIVRNAKQQARR